MSVKRLAVLIDADLHRRFKALVAEKGLDMSDILRELVEQWVQENSYPLGYVVEDSPPQDQEQLKVLGHETPHDDELSFSPKTSPPSRRSSNTG